LTLYNYWNLCKSVDIIFYDNTRLNNIIYVEGLYIFFIYHHRTTVHQQLTPLLIFLCTKLAKFLSFWSTKKKERSDDENNPEVFTVYKNWFGKLKTKSMLFHCRATLTSTDTYNDVGAPSYHNRSCYIPMIDFFFIPPESRARRWHDDMSWEHWNTLLSRRDRILFVWCSTKKLW